MDTGTEQKTENGKPGNNSRKNRKRMKSSRKDWKWTAGITLFSFIVSIAASLVSSSILDQLNTSIAILILLFIISIGIVFDIIGIAVTAAEEKPFHAMAARKVYGAREAIRLIRNANRVANFCNDVVGDICGILSGSVVAFIAISLEPALGPVLSIVVSLAATGLVSAMTIGGKAIGKGIAMNLSHEIIIKVGATLRFLSRRK